MSVQITNLSNGDTVTYSLPLLVGDVKPPMHQSTVDVQVNKEQSLSWPVYNGRFKALVPVKQGRNAISLKYYGEVTNFELHFKVLQVDRFVSPVYIKCIDDDGQFQGAEGQDCSVESARQRISLGAKLLQTFTAEKLSENGFGHKTFVLENDLHPDSPTCHVFTSRLKVEEARAMCGTELWMHFAKELMSSQVFDHKEKCKWLAYLSFTRYDIPTGKVPKTHSEVLRNTRGHTALGGGGLALYGTGTLHCWAQSLVDVTKCFTDARKIDRTKFMDDSAYREFYWANYSTGLGASLHELGHTFDLAHTPTGVMARGFDDLYRVFLVQPLCTRSSTPSDNSRSASPVPYSPKESPIHRPKSVSSRSGSPKPCPPLRPRALSLSDDPKVIQIEAAFRRMQGPSKLTFTQNNYDGSQTQKSVTRYSDGTEHITEVTLQSDGEQTIQEHLKHIPSGKTRTTMSLSMYPCDAETSPSTSPKHCTDKTPDQTDVQRTLSKISAMPNGFSFQEKRCLDGGAHWYRSSAVLLKYHKWFNPSNSADSLRPPSLNGKIIEAPLGLRIIEVRSQPEGVVIHHWEFLQKDPPLHFTLEPHHIRYLLPQCREIGILVEDDNGNIFKKKLHLNELIATKGDDMSEITKTE